MKVRGGEAVAKCGGVVICKCWLACWRHLAIRGRAKRLEILSEQEAAHMFLRSLIYRGARGIDEARGTMAA